MIGSTHGATPAQTHSGLQERLENRGVLAGVTNCGRSQKQAAEEDWHGDVNPGLAAMLDCLGPHILGQNQDHVALGCCLLPCDLGSRRDLAGRKGVKRLLLMGHE